MEVKNNKEELHLQYYTDRFGLIDPEQRAKVLEIPYADGCFSLTFLGKRYQIHWPDGDVSSDEEDAWAAGSNQARIFLLRYLLNGQPFPANGKYLSFRELPSGEVYIRPFTGREAVCLPSTSPANARWTLDKLAGAWRAIRLQDAESNEK